MADYTKPIPGNQSVALTNDVRAASGFTHKFVIKAADMATAETQANNDTVTVDLLKAPAGSIVTRIACRVKESFTANKVNTYAVGVTAAKTAYLGASNANATGILPITGAVATGRDLSTATEITAQFTPSSGHKPEDATAGELEIYLHLVNLNEVS